MQRWLEWKITNESGKEIILNSRNRCCFAVFCYGLNGEIWFDTEVATVQ